MKSAILLIQLSAIVGPTATFAWTTPNTSDCRCTTRCFATVSRRTLFESSLVAPVAAVVSAAAISTAAPQSALAAGAATTLPNGVSYVVLKSAKPIKGMSAEEEELLKPVVGELIAIRFAAYANGIKIDDIYDNPEPYYTRLGSGGLIAGVEQTLPLMKLGDRWELTIPGNLAFGNKGRPASAGKPRIPADATVVFDVEMVGIPGKEPELIELIGDF